MQPLNKIKSEADIKLACGRIGMYPLRITNEDTLRSLIWLTIDQGFKTDSDAAIPLAYDFGCVKGTCTGRFSSLEVFGNGSDITKPLTMLFKQTSGAGLSEDMVTEKIAQMEGQDAFMIKNSKIIFGKLAEQP